MFALAALLLGTLSMGAGRPPTASAGPARVPLAITSWCWDARCGAPLGQSPRKIVVARGTPVRVELTFDAVDASVTVGGAREKPTTHGREVSWTATHGGVSPSM